MTYLLDPSAREAEDRSPLETAEDAFLWLVTGPGPVTVDGRLFPGLPDRQVPLHQLRTRLATHRLSSATRDAVWAHLVFRARTEDQGSTWTLACAGVALPELTRIAAHIAIRYTGHPAEIEAAVLAGFLAEVHRTDICDPRIMARLRTAADRAGRTLRDTLRTSATTGVAQPDTMTGHTAAVTR